MNLKKEIENIWEELSGVDDELGVKYTIDLFKRWALQIVGEDESIRAVHKYFTRLEVEREKTRDIHPTTAYDYAGGMVNGRNELKQEIRQRIEESTKEGGGI